MCPTYFSLITDFLFPYRISCEVLENCVTVSKCMRCLQIECFLAVKDCFVDFLGLHEATWSSNTMST